MIHFFDHVGTSLRSTLPIWTFLSRSFCLNLSLPAAVSSSFSESVILLRHWLKIPVRSDLFTAMKLFIPKIAAIRPMKEMSLHTFVWSHEQRPSFSRDWVAWQKRGLSWSWAAACQSQGMESKEASCAIKRPTIASFWRRDIEIAISPFAENPEERDVSDSL